MLKCVFVCFQIKIKAEAPVLVALMQRSHLNFHLTPAQMFHFPLLIASMSSTNPSRVSHPFTRKMRQKLEWRLEDHFSQSQNIGSTLRNFSKNRCTVVCNSLHNTDIPFTHVSFSGKDLRVLNHMFYYSRTVQSSTRRSQSVYY